MAKKEKNFSRRDFLKILGIAKGALIGEGIIGANTNQQNAGSTSAHRIF
ncbi:hypothetical protein [Planococcus soli]|nr:hypothetical protein [Planococcus soli]